MSSAPYNPFGFKSDFRALGMGGGPIAFDYGAKTYRFGAGVDEAEAAVLVERLRERLPGA